ncbi:MAG: N-6 DNA methylase [Actinomycetota bacterium]|nr:N-6 DNA methylase [Actinomycetota bacterium]
MEFAASWGGYQGGERQEAQTFLNDLLACYGTDRRGVGARFEERAGTGFMDMIWPGVCIVEMKRPSEAGRLEAHRGQALEYWQRSGTPRQPAPRYVVLCAFHRFEIWEPGAVYTEPRAAFELVELPDNLDALLFLAGDEPVFTGTQAELTRGAVALVTDLYNRLRERRGAEPETLRDFVLQAVWSMFAEDLAILPAHLFTRLLDGLLRESSRSSADDLGRLFGYLARPDPRPQHGVYAGTPYADGGLFATPAEVHLGHEELELLRLACDFDWKRVEPAIFGSLLEGALGKERQWALGAHYTAEADILKVVRPTIVEPWRERIRSCTTLAQVHAAQQDLMSFVVLDPACGSGNFLYVAYRELRRIEAELRRRAADMRRSAGLRSQETLALYFPLTNMKGIETEPFAVKLARVTLWMGHKLAVEELDLEERVLPLADLSGIQRADALAIEWPRADAIVGNPPYHGSQRIRGELGDEYAEWLKREFEIGLKDYAVYWFRKAHERLEPGGRAGLVATNSITQNRSRAPSLGWIVQNGGVITEGVSKQPWPGVAVVNVSIVNWVKEPPGPPARFVLDSEEVDGITPALRPIGRDVSQALPLEQNRGRAFQGPIPAGAGFVLTSGEADELLARPEADYAEVVRPYLVGEDLADDPEQRPRRWVIDFAHMTLEDAARFPAALDIVRARVKPERDRNRDARFREYWWRFGRPRGEMRAAIAPLRRFIAGTAQGKRIFFTWQDARVCPSNLVNVFAFEDDYALGVLTSRLHGEWARAQSSTLRIDVRYTPTSAFETFPWPAPTDDQRERIGQLSKAIVDRRRAICVDREIGLTALYNEVDEGAYSDLRDLHTQLDLSVAAAYGWPATAARDPRESNRRLLELNARIAAGEVEYAPFGSSG